MKIYRMTATFGKLEHATLTLQPGLNIIEAPNEWGKSTWCAFLAAMLYGVDTRTKTTKTALADKERYAPWSGSPMSGRIDLHWQGRDITIERNTRGRIPMGIFRAYETETGLGIPELTAANCGHMLLGVEQSVFRRAGFIRLKDMPVTQDEALRRRLNDLVTTGDESGTGDILHKQLKELRNRCRYNRSGLLPQTEGERDALEEKLQELDALEIRCRNLKQRLGDVKSTIRELRNHADALACAEAEADAHRVAIAREARDRAQRRLETLEHGCANLPPEERAAEKLRQLKEFEKQWMAAQRELHGLPEPPILPDPPGFLAGMDADRAKETVREDAARYWQLRGRKAGIGRYLLTGLAAAAAAVLLAMGRYLYGGIAAGAVVVLLMAGVGAGRSARRAAKELVRKYGSEDPARWTSELETYLEAKGNYDRAKLHYQISRSDLDVRLDALEKQRASLCGSQLPEEVVQIWQQILQRWEEYHAARQELERSEHFLQTLQAMAKTTGRPAMADHLTYSPEQTARLLEEAAAEQQRLQNRLGQYQGRMEVLGDRDVMQKQLFALETRIGKLEDTYAALTVAMETLSEAKQALQRRFAPRIARRAQQLLGKMTAGRYDRLTLGEDLSLWAGAEGEDVLRDALWRSDGTVDQLYLSLRLAVAEELTPQAPLVLDDALVRFDDARLKAALDILQELSETKQVICFTCQSREWQLRVPTGDSCG